MHFALCILHNSTYLCAMSKKINPFPVTGYQGPAYFCDREIELERLSEAIDAGRNTTLIALRRMGKTALLMHLFEHLRQQRQPHLSVYLDLMPTGSLKDLQTALITAIARAFPEEKPLGRKIWQWLKSIRPTISYDPYSGDPTVSFELGRVDEQLQSIADALRILDDSDARVIIALDEFQQITQYPEKQTEAWLRSQFQLLKNTVFIFSGSQQAILQEMFVSAKRPFYASTQLLTLSYIDRDSYAKFIRDKFQEADRSITTEAVNEGLTWCRSHTYYVQSLCNRLYARAEKDITVNQVHEVIGLWMKEQEPIFYNYRELLTNAQWNFLKAVAKEGKLYNPTAGAFMRKHRLGSVGTIQRSLESLLSSEMLFKEVDNDGKAYYQVYDVLLSRWLEIM